MPVAASLIKLYGAGSCHGAPRTSYRRPNARSVPADPDISLATGGRNPNHRATMPEIRPPQPLPLPDIDPLLLEARPVVYVARELRGQLRGDFVVTRHTDDTDAEYQSRTELFALLLDYAELDSVQADDDRQLPCKGTGARAS
jgi:hypothetical protein